MRKVNATGKRRSRQIRSSELRQGERSKAENMSSSTAFPFREHKIAFCVANASPFLGKERNLEGDAADTGIFSALT